MSVRVVLATRNAHKVLELERLVRAAGLDVELVGTGAYPDLPEVPETEDSFAGNALLKAHAVCAHTGLTAIADDSGLCVDALNGMPGIFSARWSGSHGNDLANLQLLLDQVSDVPDDRRGAAFRCAAALVTPDGTEHVVEGQVDGTLAWAPRGTNGFGYDPIFVPTGDERTLAEFSDDEKDAISHRGKAMRALVPILADLLSSPVSIPQRHSRPVL